MHLFTSPHAGFGPLLFLGLAVGFVAGMFGVGGGFMLTPLLNLLLGVPYPIAVGSGLCQMIATATSAYLRHRELDQGEPRVDLLMLGGSLLGVHLGTETLGYLSRLQEWTVFGHAVPAVKLVLEPGYMLVLLVTAGLMVAQSRQRAGAAGVTPGPLARLRIPPYVDLKHVGLRRVSVPVVAYLGLGLGFLSGLLGIGGGVALMPVLIYGFGFPIREAAGTGILLLLVTVIAGTLDQAFAGHVQLAIALPLLLGSGLGAQLGAVATHRLRSHQLRVYFALVVLGTVAALAWDLAQALGARG